MQAKLDRAILHLDAGELNKALDLFSDVWLEGNAQQKAVAIEHLHMMVEDVGGPSGATGRSSGPKQQSNEIFAPAGSAKAVLSVSHPRKGGGKNAKTTAPQKSTVQSVTIGGPKVKPSPALVDETAVASAAGVMAAGRVAPGIDPAVLELARKEKAALEARVAALEGQLEGARSQEAARKAKEEEAARLQADVDALQKELALSREKAKKLQSDTASQKNAKLEMNAKLAQLEQELAAAQKSAKREMNAKLAKLEEELALSRESAKKLKTDTVAHKTAKQEMDAKAAKLEAELAASREKARRVQEAAEAEKAAQAQQMSAKMQKLEKDLTETKKKAKKLQEEFEDERAYTAPVRREESIDIASLPKDQPTFNISAPVKNRAAAAAAAAAAKRSAMNVTAEEEGASVESNIKRPKQQYNPDEDPYGVGSMGSEESGGNAGRPQARGGRLSIEDSSVAEVEKVKEETRDINFAANNMELTAESTKLLDSLKPLFAKEPAEVVVRGFASPLETNPERLAKVRAKLIEKLVRRQFDVPSDRITAEWGVGIGKEDQKVILVIRR